MAGRICQFDRQLNPTNDAPPQPRQILGTARPGQQDQKLIAAGSGWYKPATFNAQYPGPVVKAELDADDANRERDFILPFLRPGLLGSAVTIGAMAAMVLNQILPRAASDRAPKSQA